VHENKRHLQFVSWASFCVDI